MLMQAIAAENNLAETAFTVPSERDDADYELRWFTPAVEVPLCGHATLAAGHILIRSDKVRFSTKSGILTVTRRDDLLELDLPAARLTEVRRAGAVRGAWTVAHGPSGSTAPASTTARSSRSKTKPKCWPVARFRAC